MPLTLASPSLGLGLREVMVVWGFEKSMFRQSGIGNVRGCGLGKWIWSLWALLALRHVLRAKPVLPESLQSPAPPARPGPQCSRQHPDCCASPSSSWPLLYRLGSHPSPSAWNSLSPWEWFLKLSKWN